MIISVSVDLSGFTNLKRVVLSVQSDMNLKQQIAFLRNTLSTVASYGIFDVSFTSVWTTPAIAISDLDAIILQMSALKEVDAVLAPLRFRHLRQLRISFSAFHIQYDPIQDLAFAPEAMLPTFAAESSSKVYSAAASQLPPSEDTSTLTSHDHELCLKHHAEDLIRLKIVEELKHFNSRGKLDVRISVVIRKPSEWEYKLRDALVALQNIWSKQRWTSGRAIRQRLRS